MNNIQIGIDIHTVDGTYQGIRTHVLEIFSKVVALCPEINFYLFLQNPTILSEFSDNFNLPNVTTLRIPVNNPFLRLMWFFPLMQKKYNLDYFHSQYIFPCPLFSKGLVTIHDVLFETHPQYFSTFFKFRSKLLIRHAAKISDRIFTVSKYSKDAIIKQYDINPEKITIIYNAASNVFSNTDKNNDILEKFSLKSKNYLLTVGRNDIRKNYNTLIKAYSIIQDKVPTLVIVDSTSKSFSLKKTIERYKLQDKIKVISNINNKVLSEFYKNAKLFIYPSYAEGFGIPVIESMASGLCTIISETTSLQELGKGAAFFINPNKPYEIANTILKLLSDDKIRAKYENLSLRRAAEFTWDEQAQKVAEIYKSLR
jgi:glycosyltransferase involved in cell wall biosynthesis